MPLETVSDHKGISLVYTPCQQFQKWRNLVESPCRPLPVGLHARMHFLHPVDVETTQSWPHRRSISSLYSSLLLEQMFHRSRSHRFGCTPLHKSRLVSLNL